MWGGDLTNTDCVAHKGRGIAGDAAALQAAMRLWSPNSGKEKQGPRIEKTEKEVVPDSNNATTLKFDKELATNNQEAEPKCLEGSIGGNATFFDTELRTPSSSSSFCSSSSSSQNLDFSETALLMSLNPPSSQGNDTPLFTEVNERYSETNRQKPEDTSEGIKETGKTVLFKHPEQLKHKHIDDSLLTVTSTVTTATDDTSNDTGDSSWCVKAHNPGCNTTEKQTNVTVASSSPEWPDQKENEPMQESKSADQRKTRAITSRLQQPSIAISSSQEETDGYTVWSDDNDPSPTCLTLKYSSDFEASPFEPFIQGVEETSDSSHDATGLDFLLSFSEMQQQEAGQGEESLRPKSEPHLNLGAITIDSFDVRQFKHYNMGVELGYMSDPGDPGSSPLGDASSANEWAWPKPRSSTPSGERSKANIQKGREPEAAQPIGRRRSTSRDAARWKTKASNSSRDVLRSFRGQGKKITDGLREEAPRLERSVSDRVNNYSKKSRSALLRKRSSSGLTAFFSPQTSLAAMENRLDECASSRTSSAGSFVSCESDADDEKGCSGNGLDEKFCQDGPDSKQWTLVGKQPENENMFEESFLTPKGMLLVLPGQRCFIPASSDGNGNAVVRESHAEKTKNRDDGHDVQKKPVNDPGTLNHVGEVPFDAEMEEKLASPVINATTKSTDDIKTAKKSSSAEHDTHDLHGRRHGNVRERFLNFTKEKAWRSPPLPRNAVPVHTSSMSLTSPLDYNPMLLISTMKRVHQGAIWVMKFDPNGMYLATAGEDMVILVWEVSPEQKQRNGGGPDARDKQKSHSDDLFNPPRWLEHSSTRTELGYGSTLGTDLKLLASKPLRRFQGHKADVVDLSWSRGTSFLLSASLDKTVRLWHITQPRCLHVFEHRDYVTSVHFHPKDDEYFVSGSMDKKLCLWSIKQGAVTEWAQTPDIITACAFTPSGNMVVAGMIKGQVYFYNAANLRYFTQVACRNRHGSKKSGRKVTGLAFRKVARESSVDPSDLSYAATSISPPRSSKQMGYKSSRKFWTGNPKVKRTRSLSVAHQLLVTTNDSRIRLFGMDDFCLRHKFKGTVNTCMQIKACFSGSGHYILCGSEQGSVHLWNCSSPPQGLSSTITYDRSRPVASFLASETSESTAATGALFAPRRSVELALLRRRGRKESQLDEEDEHENLKQLLHHQQQDSSSAMIVTSDYEGTIRIFLKKSLLDSVAAYSESTSTSGISDGISDKAVVNGNSNSASACSAT